MTACDEKPTQPTPTPKTSVIDPQIKALEKAKGVEAGLNQQAEEQRKQIEAAENK